MTHALVTVIAPLDLRRLEEAEGAIDLLGNPARPELRDALDRTDGMAGTHFASLHAIRSADGARGWIVLELSADGAEEEALARVVAGIGDHLRPIFMLARDWRDGGDLGRYLRDHRVAAGHGWFDSPGLDFAGTPGMTVGRIRAEAELALEVTRLIGQQPGQMHALQRVKDVRSRLRDEPSFAAMLEPATPEPPWAPPSTPSLAARLAASFAVTYLWPVALVLLGWAVYAGLDAARLQPGWAEGVSAFVAGALGAAWSGLWLALLGVALVALALYALLRAAEARDWVDERAPERATNAAMFERENRCAQNHMISVTQRKPGLVRWVTIRLVFWIIGALATARSYRPGFLGGIGTIHFARWATAPGSPDLIFMSNYGGSWESYLEDFITLANEGLTAVWSNTIGFPRTENLFQKGATDGERFKRFARHSMVPTRFWYGAYPNLTTAAIRTNAEIRRGLSTTMTEDEAVRWLALLGSAARPAAKLVSSEIQSIVFGGLGFMPFGTCLVLDDLPEEVDAARAWLAGVTPHIAFNDGRRLRDDAIVTLALGAPGLARLGLPADSLETFPFAFLEGMTTGARSRMLGDVRENAPEHWRWGKSQPAAVLLVYGRSGEAVNKLTAKLVEDTRRHRAPEPYVIPLREVGKDKKEPFGFVDGISQPVIRGTYKGLRNADPIHLVEPGEFVLGYPDNRGHFPPGPTLPATADPQNRLPLLDWGRDFGRAVVESTRDVGFNGSFLVVREFEQDVKAFENYCKQEAERLAAADRLPAPYVISDEFIAAKLVGRWKDGSSLVRHPYEPAPKESERYGVEAGKAHGARGTMRPTTHPDGAPPVERPPEPSPPADNDFLFGTEDPEALRCPFGAHVRRANPRDSLAPGSDDQIDISNRHRIIRVGRQYLPQEGQKPGLLFMCLNNDIERQFEFLQQTWLMSPSFHGLAGEKDPVLADGEDGVCGYTIPTREGPVRLATVPRFVTTKGGGYFFLPGKRLIEYLAAIP